MLEPGIAPFSVAQRSGCSLQGATLAFCAGLRWSHWKTAGGSDLASSIVLHEGGTAPARHHEQPDWSQADLVVIESQSTDADDGPATKVEQTKPTSKSDMSAADDGRHGRARCGDWEVRGRARADSSAHTVARNGDGPSSTEVRATELEQLGGTSIEAHVRSG